MADHQAISPHVFENESVSTQYCPSKKPLEQLLALTRAQSDRIENLIQPHRWTSLHHLRPDFVA